jgi:hypothetical protein
LQEAQGTGSLIRSQMVLQIPWKEKLGGQGFFLPFTSSSTLQRIELKEALRFGYKK